MINDDILFPITNKILLNILQKSYCKTIQRYAEKEVFHLQKVFQRTTAERVKIGFKTIIETFNTSLSDAHQNNFIQNLQRNGVNRVYS